LGELSEDALIQILQEPKNALTKQYQALFSIEDVELEFRREALIAIAKKAMNRKTGARGLRSIVEAALLNTMYDLPSMENVEKWLSMKRDNQPDRTDADLPQTGSSGFRRVTES
ncbi:hypothetical protein ABN09_14425, partial [Morganella morganii]